MTIKKQVEKKKKASIKKSIEARKPDFSSMKLAEINIVPPEVPFCSEKCNLRTLPLSNVQIQYLSATIQHLNAELQLLLEVRRAGDLEYEKEIADYLRTLLQTSQNFLIDTKII